MAINEAALEAKTWAATHVPEVLRTFLRVADITQEQLGDLLGLSVRQVSRRLNVPGAIAQEEIAALAAVFGVEVATFYKPLRQAVGDLMRSSKVDELRSGSSTRMAA